MELEDDRSRGRPTCSRESTRCSQAILGRKLDLFPVKNERNQSRSLDDAPTPRSLIQISQDRHEIFAMEGSRYRARSHVLTRDRSVIYRFVLLLVTLVHFFDSRLQFFFLSSSTYSINGRTMYSLYYIHVQLVFL